jgi:hypothetical protein
VLLYLYYCALLSLSLSLSLLLAVVVFVVVTVTLTIVVVIVPTTTSTIHIYVMLKECGSVRKERNLSSIENIKRISLFIGTIEVVNAKLGVWIFLVF